MPNLDYVFSKKNYKFKKKKKVARAINYFVYNIMRNAC